MRVLLYFFSFWIISSTLYSQQGTVIKVKDGDTIVILDDKKQTHTIRIANIDCPEKGQPFSKVAKDFVSNEIFGQPVYVEYLKTDRYGRTIGNVFYDDKSLSEELLKSGLAWHYSYYSKDKKLASLELEARKKEIGLWSEKNPINPYDWRRRKKL